MKRVQIFMRILKCLFSIFAILTSANAEVKNDPVLRADISHYAFGAKDSLQFAFISQRPGLIYLRPLFGIKIQKVIVDGDQVAGLEQKINPEEQMYATTTVEGIYIYITKGDALISVQSFDENAVTIKRFQLDQRASRIEVIYQVRYPDGRMGESQSTVSFRDDMHQRLKEDQKKASR
jgi:hypothetical protein